MKVNHFTNDYFPVCYNKKRSRMDVYKAWLAFLSSIIIQRCHENLTNNCDACKAGLIASILHFHNHYNLLDMMKKYSTVVTPEMDIGKLFNLLIVTFVSMKHQKNSSKQESIL